MELTLTPQLRLKVSPQLVASSHMLELSSLELQQAVVHELAENPALENVEEPTCEVCGGVLRGSICPHCLSEQKLPAAPLDQRELDDEVYFSTSSSASDEEFDPMTRVADQPTLAESLMVDLCALLATEDVPIAEYLIGNLDDRGWLDCEVEEAAGFLGVDVARVEAVHRTILKLEPIGVGARDLRECLLAQLDYLEQEQGRTQPHAREIVESHLTELGERKLCKIANDLKIGRSEVEEAWEFIRRNCHPYPARQFGPDMRGDAKPILALPDVIVSVRDRCFEVQVVESRRFFLRLSPVYECLNAELQQDRSRFSEEERAHIQSYVSRARLFLLTMKQRRQTLHRIATCLVVHQRDFLLNGVRHLQPLTRAAIAAELGLHESTISRATQSKFMMLPNQQVVPFSMFFVASLPIKDVIKEMVETEQSHMSDHEIAERLADCGTPIARRTVAKYRSQLRILSSKLR